MTETTIAVLAGLIVGAAIFRWGYVMGQSLTVNLECTHRIDAARLAECIWERWEEWHEEHSDEDSWQDRHDDLYGEDR